MPPPDHQLTLVGTVHLDPDGPALLTRLLEELGPEAVTVEVSEYALEFRRTLGPELLARLDPFRLPDGRLPNGLAAVAAQLLPPFEHSAAAAYAGRTGAALAAVGDGQLSRRLLFRLERELMVTDNLVKLATRDEPPLREQVRTEWQRARGHHRAGPPLGSDAVARLAGMDRGLARRIRAQAGAGRLVHVGGWEHLRGLAEILADLGPIVRLLSPD
ncbi:MAG TPA: hypothetical protein PK668_17045 [Myxococcota bacterium]|nr:hypothetical protein [Myxococcota bacterium]HRY94867.1 hypothetical protein [Myxococcota bacterium]HSA23167.1 hypothetical protein [Myxococcota bacterium]